jgi:hypothetical protein
MPSNRKAAAALQRERGREARAKARQALISGDERHLPARDAGPERRLARDVVDSRFTIGQVFIFLIFAVLIGGTAITSATKSTLAQSLVNVGILVVFTAVIIDCARCGRMAKKAVGEKFGYREVRGISSYAFIRAMQPRRFRRPPPKVMRGGASITP